MIKGFIAGSRQITRLPAEVPSRTLRAPSSERYEIASNLSTMQRRNRLGITTGHATARHLAAIALAVVASVVAPDAQGRQDSFIGLAERTITHGGRQRTYLVHDFGRGGPAPMVIVLHGGGGNADVTGMSNGGMLSHRLGRELSAKVAAIAPVVGAVFGDEPPPQAAVPAFIVVGAADQIVPPSGGPLSLRLLLGSGSAADRDVAPAMAQATYWARHNGCGEPTRTQTSASSRTEWTTCSSGAPVVFHSVAGNGHAWPGGEPGGAGAAQPTQAFDVTEEMWAFFRKQVPRR